MISFFVTDAVKNIYFDFKSDCSFIGTFLSVCLSVYWAFFLLHFIS